MSLWEEAFKEGYKLGEEEGKQEKAQECAEHYEKAEARWMEREADYLELLDAARQWSVSISPRENFIAGERLMKAVRHFEEDE